MPTYGKRPQDVVRDSFGNTLDRVVVTLHTSASEAESGASPVGITLTNYEGRWLLFNAAAGLWVRANGDVWPGDTASGGVGGGVTAHADLTGLSADDHPQYHNDARGDARYYTKTANDALLAGKAATTHTHTSSQLTDGTTIGRSLFSAASQAAAQSILGVTSLTIGTTAGTAKSGDYVPSWGEVTGKPSTFPPATHTHTSTDLTDSTGIGRSLLQAPNGPSARATIGAGTSDLALGTTSSTAKAGNYVPAWTEVTGKPSTFTPAAHTHTPADVTGLAAVATSGALSDVGGTLGLAQLHTGGVFVIIWSGTAWTYNGVNITSRPSARTDLTMLALGGTTQPSFGITGKDIWLKDLS